MNSNSANNNSHTGCRLWHIPGTVGMSGRCSYDSHFIERETEALNSSCTDSERQRLNPCSDPGCQSLPQVVSPSPAYACMAPAPGIGPSHAHLRSQGTGAQVGGGWEMGGMPGRAQVPGRPWLPPPIPSPHTLGPPQLTGAEGRPLARAAQARFTCGETEGGLGWVNFPRLHRN